MRRRPRDDAATDAWRRRMTVRAVRHGRCAGDGDPRLTSLAGALVDGGARIVQLRMKGADARRAARRRARRWRLVPRARVVFVVNDRARRRARRRRRRRASRPGRSAARRRARHRAGRLRHRRLDARRGASARRGRRRRRLHRLRPRASRRRRKRTPIRSSGSSGWRASAPASLPVVAIGGITLDTVADVARAGAAAAAIIRAVNRAPDVTAAARAVTAAFA